MLSQTMNKLMDVGETMGAGKHSVELYVKIVNVVRHVGCALVATVPIKTGTDMFVQLDPFLCIVSLVRPPRSTLTGVHGWCSLMFIDVVQVPLSFPVAKHVFPRRQWLFARQRHH